MKILSFSILTYYHDFSLITSQEEKVEPKNIWLKIRMDREKVPVLLK